MRYCTRCLYPKNHPLGITFDHQGVCSGCRVHEEKDVLDWRKRGQTLKKLFDAFRGKGKRYYDCIIPVSGARDSYFIVDTVKNVYGMHPLLVTYNKHYNTQLGIRNLANLRTLFGCDLLTMTVSPETVKKITRVTLSEMGSLYWHCLAGQTVFPVQIAVRFKIPLIVWGAHQGCDQVGMFSHEDEVEMTRKYRKDHDLMGYEAEDLVALKAGITESDVIQFRYPHNKEIEGVGVRGIYLNNYIRWDSKAQHESMIKKYRYETFTQARTFDTYNDVDCFHYSEIHDHIKFLKVGYGKVTDHASREIRLKRMTRNQGIEQVRRYQYSKPRHTHLFLDWIGMNEKELTEMIDPFRNAAIWHKNQSGQWEGLHHVTPLKQEPSLITKPSEPCEFRLTPLKSSLADDHYVLIGRGWSTNESR